MQISARTAKLTVKDGWLTCPNCRRNKRLMRVDAETEGNRIHAWCPKCKNEVVLNIARGLSVERLSP